MSEGRLRALELIRVRGRSMLPTLADGDVLLVRGGRHAHRRIHPGRIVVVRLSPDRPVAVKRLGIRDGSGWWVERDNPREGVDSWSVGSIPDRDVVARVLTRVRRRRGSAPA